MLLIHNARNGDGFKGKIRRQSSVTPTFLCYDTDESDRWLQSIEIRGPQELDA